MIRCFVAEAACFEGGPRQDLLIAPLSFAGGLQGLKLKPFFSLDTMPSGVRVYSPAEGIDLELALESPKSILLYACYSMAQDVPDFTQEEVRRLIMDMLPGITNERRQGYLRQAGEQLEELMEAFVADGLLCASWVAAR